MNKKSVFTIVVGTFIGLLVGFVGANSYYRNNLDELKTPENSSLNQKKDDNDLQVSDSEIAQKISEADKNPDQIEFQKQLGIALFQLTNTSKDIKYMPDVIRLLNRVYEKKPKDYDVIITLGDANLMQGKKNNEEEGVKKGREFYQKSLQIKPNEVEVITNIGMSYLPDQKEKAMAEFEKSLKINPKHERTLLILEKIKEQQ